MDMLPTLQPINDTDAQRMREHLERVQREQTEWLEAQLHARLHGGWDRGACIICTLDASIAKANER
jgi:hypothetical protein